MKVVSLRGILLFIISLCVCGGSLALDSSKPFSQYVKDTWSIQDGLPHSTVNDIVQDASGFIWIATQNGLAKYDGSSFQVFNTANSELNSNIITSLFVDSKERLWVGSYRGIYRYELGALKAVFTTDYEEWQVNDFIELADDKIFFATDKRLLVFVDEKVRPIRSVDFPAYSLALHHGKLLIGSQGRLLRYTETEVESYELPEASEDLRIHDIYIKDNNIILATESGLFRLILNRIERYFADLSDQEVNEVVVDEEKNIWLATNSGLSIKRTNDESFVAIPETFHINALFEDREYNLWVGTNEFGLMRFWSGRVERYSRQEGLGNQNTWSIIKTSKGYLVGTSDGVYLFDGKRFFRVAMNNRSLIYSMHALDNGDILLGSKQGLYLFRDGVSQQLPSMEILEGVQVNGFYEEKGIVHILTTRGVYVYEESGELKRYDDVAIMQSDIRSMISFQPEVWWFGTKNGLVTYSATSDDYVSIPKALKEAFVTSIVKTDDKVWLGTYSSGLFVYDGKWHQITQENGLLSNNIFNIARSGEHLWISCFYGLYRVTLKQIEQVLEKESPELTAQSIISEESSLFPQQSGHCCHGVGPNKILQEDEILWYVTNDGIIKVDTSIDHVNNIAPKVSITEIATASEAYSTHLEKESTLEITERDIRLSFAALSFQNPKSNRYKVRLKGFDSRWQPIQNQNSVSYTNLSPGNYRFEVLGSNNVGIYSTEPASIRFTIIGKFTESIWFKLLNLIVTIVLFYSIFLLIKQKAFEDRSRLEGVIHNLENEKAELINKVEDVEHFMETHAYVDQLTGAFTYKFLEQQLNMDIPYYERILPEDIEQQESIVFVMLDIDNFSAVNANYSHEIGDLILQQVTNLIKRTIRDSDYVVRYKSDSFIVIFRPVLEEHISVVTERIRQLVENCRFEINKDDFIQITSSISYADYPIFPEVAQRLCWTSLISLTEKGLKEAKMAGGNRWVGYQVNEYIMNMVKETNQLIYFDDIDAAKFEQLKSWQEPESN